MKQDDHLALDIYFINIFIVSDDDDDVDEASYNNNNVTIALYSIMSVSL